MALTLQDKLAAGRFVITAEVTPPVSADRKDLLAKALPLKGLADAVNVTDGAGARPHLGALAAATMLVEAGVDLGYGYASQSLRDGRHFNAHDVTGGLAVVASAPIGRMRVAFDGMFGGTAFKLDRSETVKPVAIASLVLLYGF